jgi:hypothetical protein
MLDEAYFDFANKPKGVLPFHALPCFRGIAYRVQLYGADFVKHSNNQHFISQCQNH